MLLPLYPPLNSAARRLRDLSRTALLRALSLPRSAAPATVTHHLRESEVLSLPPARYRLDVLAGHLWLTQSGDPADHLLPQGVAFLPDPHRKLALQALTPTRLQITWLD